MLCIVWLHGILIICGLKPWKYFEKCQGLNLSFSKYPSKWLTFRTFRGVFDETFHNGNTCIIKCNLLNLVTVEIVISSVSAVALNLLLESIRCS